MLDAATPSVSPALDARVRARANEVLAALQAKDMKALAALVHPTRGVRFSPYPYVDTQADVVLTRAALSSAMTDGRVRTWGARDGSGEPIKLKFPDYYRTFVWTHDFTKAPTVSVDSGEGTGNTADNILEAYPRGHYIELYFPGFEAKFGSMDWESLRLVFENADVGGGDGMWLVGIIHGTWTI